jgi:hypothetical protein
MLRFLVLAVVFFISSVSFAEQTSKEQRVNQVFNFYKTEKSIKGFCSSFLKGLEQGLFSQVPQGQTKVRDLIKKAHALSSTAFAPQDFFANYRNKYIELVNEQDLIEEIKTFDIPKIKELQATIEKQDLSYPEKQEEFKKYLETLKSNPVSASRVEIIKQLDDMTLSTETMVLASLSAARETTMAFKAIFPENPRIAIPTEDDLSKLRSSIRPQLHYLMISALLFITRDLPDSDLQITAELGAKPYSKRLSKVMHESLLYAINTASKKYGKLLAVELKLQKQK